MSLEPRLSITLRTFAADDPGTWDPVIDQARAADAAGVDQLVVSDHVVFGENLEAYARPELGGSEGGKQPTGPDGLWLEPLTTLTYVAAVTDQIRLGTNILLAALRRPVVLAKTAATLDVLSGGRLDLGVGVGWQREEYDAAGLDFDGRGALLDQTLAVCQTLWREQRGHVRRRHAQLRRHPPDAEARAAGGVPIWVSGTVNAAVLRRLARFGSGWIPWGRVRERPRRRDPAGARRPRGARARLRRTSGSSATCRWCAATTGSPISTRRWTRSPALVDIGVTDFRAGLPIPEGLDAATEYLSTVVDAFRTAVGRA